MRLSLTLILVTSFAGWSQTTSDDRAHRVEALLNAHPSVDRGHIAYKFIDVESGDVLAAQDSDQFFTPASNVKLYTTALALVRLGPNYTFKTELRTSAPWHPGQTSISDLQLIGGGDPDLSGRVLPYAVDSTDGDSLAPLRDLADKLAQSGIREINGDVTGVATRYPGDLYPDGWTLDDAEYSYGAPVSSLAVNDNTISVIVHPSEPGQLAAIELRPALNHFVILNQVTTSASNATHIQISRIEGSNEVTVWGIIGSRAAPWRQDMAVEDPALFAAEALVSVLEDRGITVRGEPLSRYRSLNEVPDPLQEIPSAPAGTLLATRTSVPLWETIQVTNKVSQNLHAEMLLREAAFATHGIGTLQAGVSERQAFLEEIGITHDKTGFSFADGSGLARQDQTTADSTVALLRYMWHRPEHDAWLQSLPIGGVDGSLERRFHNIPGADRIHAKTGSLSHVNALSGYLETAQHRWLAFSIMVNGTSGKEAEVRDFIDHLCVLFLDE